MSPRATLQGKPIALEYKKGGPPMTVAEEQDVWFNRRPGFDYMMSVSTIDGNGFRDEEGRLRPMQDAKEYVGRCAQELSWDAASQEWDILPPLIYIGLLDPELNPAAYANDALFGQLCGLKQRPEYAARDVQVNSLVMVPGLRRVNPGDANWDKGKPFEISSMWFYPRRGWSWAADAGGVDELPELTVRATLG